MKNTILKHRFLYLFILFGLIISLNSCSSNEPIIEEEEVFKIDGVYEGSITETITYPLEPSKNTTTNLTQGSRILKDNNGYYSEQEPSLRLINGYGKVEYWYDKSNVPSEYSKRYFSLELTITKGVMIFDSIDTFYDGNDVIVKKKRGLGNLSWKY